MNLSPLETLQFIAWFLALIELILALYVISLNVWHPANCHVSVLLLVVAVNNYGLGLLLVAQDITQAAWPTYLLAATIPAVAPLTLLVTIVLLKPGWLRGRRRRAWWLVYGLCGLPGLLTLLDLGLGTRLYYTGLQGESYAGGFVLLGEYASGSMAPPIRALSTYVIWTATLIPMLYVALRDQGTTSLTRQLARLLLGAQVAMAAVQIGQGRLIAAEVSTLIASTILVMVYAYAAFQQMISERRAQQGHLQPRLTALVLVIALPVLVAVVLFVSVRADVVFRQNADERLQATNRALAANVSLWLRLNRDALNQLVSLPDIISMDPQRQRPILEATAAAYPHLFLVHTTDLTGMNVARNDDQENKDYSDREWFLGARAGNPVTFQSLVSRTTGKPALNMAAPIRDASGKIIGVGSIVSELDDLSREVRVSRVGETGFAYIVDAQNRVVAHPDPAFSAELRDLSSYPPVQALRQSTRGLISFRDDQGQRWRACIDEIGDGWGVVVQQPEAELLLGLRQLQQIAWGVMAMGAAMLLALTWLAIRQALRPITTLTDGATTIAAGDLSRCIPVESEDELGLLARTINRMTEQIRGLISSLEQRVAERTQDLERRSTYLEATAEVGRAAASILETEQLIHQVVELIRERFGLYYVGLFLVDEAREWAVLRAGTGQAGQAMLARGHRIKVGEGMIGWSIAHSQARVALEAGQDAVRLATAELPETRSEAALPLRSRGQTLGALTVQDSRPGAFDRDVIAALQAMADQVAVALDNARLFAASQTALEAARRAYGELSRQAWTELLRPRADWGYRYAQRSIAPVTSEWRPEMLQAIQAGQRVQIGFEANQDGTVGDPTILVIPLKVRDQVVGALSFRKEEGSQAWKDEELAVLEILTEQLGLALESARLFQETQRSAARERLTREITDQMRRARSVEGIVQTSVDALFNVLGTSRAFVHLEATEIVGDDGENGR